MKNKLTTQTVPAITAIVRAGRPKVWAVSPYGPTRPDREAVFATSREEAEAVAISEVVEPREHLRALLAELDGLRGYLLSPKFSEDPTVQVRDVLTRLEQLRPRAEETARDEIATLKLWD